MTPYGIFWTSFITVVVFISFASTYKDQLTFNFRRPHTPSTTFVDQKEAEAEERKKKREEKHRQIIDEYLAENKDKYPEIIKLKQEITDLKKLALDEEKKGNTEAANEIIVEILGKELKVERWEKSIKKYAMKLYSDKMSVKGPQLKACDLLRDQGHTVNSIRDENNIIVGKRVFLNQELLEAKEYYIQEYTKVAVKQCEGS